MSKASEIFNGSRCKAYSWSQSHGDLEIRVKIDKSIKVEDIQVDITKRDICVEIVRGSITSYEPGPLSEILVEGNFQHTVDTDSVYWLVETDASHNYIVIYVDKIEELWWKALLKKEKTIEIGPKCYSVAMDSLDDSSRMAVDRLVKEQQQKRLGNESNYSRDNFDSPA